MARPIAMTTVANARPSSTATVIVESTSPENSASSSQPQALTLKLVRKKKKVTWKEGTVDNEFMNKKSSKKCCIFNKDKAFDDEDDSDEDDGHGHGCYSNSNGSLLYPFFGGALGMPLSGDLYGGGGAFGDEGSNGGFVDGVLCLYFPELPWW